MASRYARARQRAAGNTVEGRHAVLEALRAGTEFEAILIALETEQGRQLTEIAKLAKQRSISVKRLPRREVNARSATKKAQGVVGIAADKRYTPLDELLSAAAADKNLFICVLDGIQDPQNLGAIARSLEVVGGSALVIRSHASASLSPGTLRAAAGALEHLKVARTSSIPSALKQLKEAGFRIVGLSLQDAEPYDKMSISLPLAVVVGNEQRGISKEAKALCDQLIYLPQRGQIGSLNVSVAAGIVFYEVMKRTGG